MSIFRVHQGVQYTDEYCKYIAGCPAHWRDIMIHVGRYHDSSGRIPQFRCGAIIRRSGDVQCIGGFNI